VSIRSTQINQICSGLVRIGIPLVILQRKGQNDLHYGMLSTLINSIWNGNLLGLKLL